MKDDFGNVYTSIYILRHPISKEIKYVGKTVRRLKERLAKHCKELFGTRVKNWINSLISDGLIPEIVEIERVYTENWAEREKFWISFYREQCDLCNLTDGGEGNSGHKHTEDTKRKLSELNFGKKVPVHIREKMSNSHKGIKLSEEHRKRISEGQKGKVMSDEQRRLISARMKGKKIRLGAKLSNEQRNKISLAHKGLTPTIETRLKISKANKGKGRPLKIYTYEEYLAWKNSKKA